MEKDGARSLKCQAKVGTGTCGQTHHTLIHGVEGSYAQANFVLGRAKQPGVPRPDIFTGRDPGSLLADGTAGDMFKLLYAPICSQDNSKVSDIVFIDGGSNMNSFTHTLAGKLGLVGTHTNIHLRVVDKQYREKEVLVFRLGVEDRFKDIHWMEAVGVDSITDAAPLQDEAEIRKAYS